MIILLSALIITLTATGQIFLKKGAILNKHLIFNQYVISGYGVFIIVMTLSITLMHYASMKYMSAIVGLNYPSTILLASLVLGEKIQTKTLAASLIILLGYIIFTL